MAERLYQLVTRLQGIPTGDQCKPIPLSLAIEMLEAIYDNLSRNQYAVIWIAVDHSGLRYTVEDVCEYGAFVYIYTVGAEQTITN